MNEILQFMPALAAGVLLGVIFFGGLWWTVRQGLSSQHPALWFLGSQLIRTSIALAGFLWVAGGHWQRLLVCLSGFIVARLFVTWLTRSSPASHSRPEQEAIHAP